MALIITLRKSKWLGCDYQVVPVCEILVYFVLERDLQFRSCWPVVYLDLFFVRATINRELTLRKQNVRNVIVTQAFLAHDTCLIENFFVYKEVSKPFLEKLLFVVDATLVSVVAPTNEVYSWLHLGLTRLHLRLLRLLLFYFYIHVN